MYRVRWISNVLHIQDGYPYQEIKLHKLYSTDHGE